MVYIRGLRQDVVLGTFVHLFIIEGVNVQVLDDLQARHIQQYQTLVLPVSVRLGLPLLIKDGHEVYFGVEIKEPLKVGLHDFEKLDSGVFDVVVDLLICERHRGPFVLQDG